jgi:hypothetical protein
MYPEQAPPGAGYGPLTPKTVNRIPITLSHEKSVSTPDQPRRSFQSFPATRAPGIGFDNQCEHWLSKQYIQSVSRPEIPQDFTAHAVLPLSRRNPLGGFLRFE